MFKYRLISYQYSLSFFFNKFFIKYWPISTVLVMRQSRGIKVIEKEGEKNILLGDKVMEQQMKSFQRLTKNKNK